MAKIVCTLKAGLMEKFGVKPPEGWEMIYVDFPCPDADIIEACKGADYLYVGPMDKLSAELMDQIKHIKLIHSLGVGFDKIDLEAAKKNNIYVCNNRAVNAVSVAEHAIGLMWACQRRIIESDAMCKTGGYMANFNDFRVKGQRELGASTVGLIGFGAIGRAAAIILKAFGSKVYYNDVFRLAEDEEKQFGIEFASLEDMYKSCDILSYHVPVLDETLGMINKENIAKMKKNVILINVARGEIVNNDDLKEALENEMVFAGLDVIAPEPPVIEEKDHILLNLNEAGNKRLTITPHIAGTTDDAFIRMQTWALDNMIRVENGERPINVVNNM